MKRIDSKHKYFVVAAAVMSLMVFALPILAQVDEFTAGRMDGERAAEASVNGMRWFLAGCTGIGLAIAYMSERTPPAIQLLGKSPEYIAAYTDAYKMNAKRSQVSKAWIGCIFSTITIAALSAVYGSDWFEDSGDYEIDTW